MPKRTLLTHEEDRFLVAEEAGDLKRPKLLIYAHAGNSKLQAATGTPTFETEENHKWAPVAEVLDGALVPGGELTDHQVEFLKSLLQRYLWERAEAIKNEKRPWWYVVVNGRPLHLVDRAQPAGLLLPLYSEQIEAEQALAESGNEGEVCSTGARREFLRFRAEEGFAGAVVDGTEFIYWCVDEAGEMQFLKLRPDSKSREVVGHLLHQDGQWTLWEGDGDLEFFENQDDWDRLMVKVLGTVPFLSYQDEMQHYSLYEAGAIAVVQNEDEERICAVFSDPEHARKYAEEHDFINTEVQSVFDLRELVVEATQAGAITRIEPEEHRAHGGLLWLREGRLILDGFSGFWDSEDGSQFRPMVL